eukprot:s240_g9.t2
MPVKSFIVDMCQIFKRNLPFEQTLQFLSQRRPAVCPNDGFQRQLRRYESSKERLLLAQDMLKVPAYTELQRQDLETVAAALSQRKARGRSVEGGRATPAKQAQAAEQRPARPGSGSVPIDQLARQRALQAVQATAQRQPGSAIRVGDGSQLLDPNWEADGEYWSFIRLGALAPPPALRAGASHRTNGKYEVRSILIDLLVDVGLAWLMPRRRSSASTATSLPPSARLGRAKRPVKLAAEQEALEQKLQRRNSEFQQVREEQEAAIPNLEHELEILEAAIQRPPEEMHAALDVNLTAKKAWEKRVSELESELRAAHRQRAEQQRKMTLLVANCRREIESREAAAKCSSAQCLKPMETAYQEALQRHSERQKQIRQHKTKRQVGNAFKVPLLQQRASKPQAMEAPDATGPQATATTTTTLLRRCSMLRFDEAQQRREVERLGEREQRAAAQLHEKPQSAGKLRARVFEPSLDLRLHSCGAMENKLEKLRRRYPAHVHSRDDKREQKLIVPNDTTGAAFLDIAREKCAWAVQGGKVLLCKGKGSTTMEVPAERTMKQLDSTFKAPDGALYFRVEAAKDGFLLGSVFIPDAVEGPQEFKMDEVVPQDQKKAKAKKVAISDKDSKDDIAEKARRVRMKHPDRVPVLINQAEAPGLPALDKKLLIPKSMTCKDLRKILPKHLGCGHLDVDWSTVIFQLAGVDVEEHELVSDVYDRCVAPDDEGIMLSLELPSEDVPPLAARDAKPPELAEDVSFSPPSAEELRVLEQQLIEVNVAFGEARKAQQVAADKLVEEEERAWAAEETALKADQELAMRCQAHKHEAEAFRSEVAEARQAREALESKLAKGTEEIDALRLHVDWLEDALQSAKQDSSKMAELQKSLKESQEALAVEARKSHAAQEKLSQLEEQFQEAADKEAKAMRMCAAKERGAEEPCVHGDHPSCPSCSKCMAFHGQEKIRKLEDSLHAVSEKLVEVEHEKAQLERETEKQHRNPDEAVKKLKDTVLILKDTLSCKEEDITAKNAQVVETMACLKAVEAENRRLQAELEAAAKETSKLQQDHALAKGEVDKLKAKMQKKDTEEDFVKLGWNSDDEVEEVTEDFGFQKVPVQRFECVTAARDVAVVGNGVDQADVQMAYWRDCVDSLRREETWLVEECRTSEVENEAQEGSQMQAIRQLQQELRSSESTGTACFPEKTRLLAAQALLAEMAKKQIAPDNKTHSLRISAYANACPKRVEDARRAFSELPRIHQMDPWVKAAMKRCLGPQAAIELFERQSRAGF